MRPRQRLVRKRIVVRCGRRCSVAGVPAAGGRQTDYRPGQGAAALLSAPEERPKVQSPLSPTGFPSLAAKTWQRLQRSQPRRQRRWRRTAHGTNLSPHHPWWHQHWPQAWGVWSLEHRTGSPSTFRYRRPLPHQMDWPPHRRLAARSLRQAPNGLLSAAAGFAGGADVAAPNGSAEGSPAAAGGVARVPDSAGAPNGLDSEGGAAAGGVELPLPRAHRMDSNQQRPAPTMPARS